MTHTFDNLVEPLFPTEPHPTPAPHIFPTPSLDLALARWAAERLGVRS